jgi:purine-binding chemotaxis protein CheW
MEDVTTAIHSEKSEQERMQLVSFNLENEEYGVEVLKVREIIRMPNITRVPNTPHYVEGVINLRGKVIPIISLRKRFNLNSSEADSRTRIMVMDMTNNLTGFVVDSVAEVIRVSSDEIQPAPPVISGSIEQECLSGVINRADRLLVLLDLERMFSREEQEQFNCSAVMQ